MVEGDDVNRYHYVYNNPVNRIDPFGETTMPPPGMRPPPDIYLDPEAWMDWYVEEASKLFNLPAPGDASGTGRGKSKPGNGQLAKNEGAEAEKQPIGGHDKEPSPSKKDKHDKGEKRRGTDQGGETKDKWNKWPPKKFGGQGNKKRGRYL